VIETTKFILFEKGLPENFWVEMINRTIYLINMCPSKGLKNQTPFEV
jgi:hypothetical protein